MSEVLGREARDLEKLMAKLRLQAKFAVDRARGRCITRAEVRIDAVTELLPLLAVVDRLTVENTAAKAEIGRLGDVVAAMDRIHDELIADYGDVQAEEHRLRRTISQALDAMESIETPFVQNVDRAHQILADALVVGVDDKEAATNEQ